jgi:cobalt-zinc-cadmium efflux system outer membrane protein
VAEAQAYVEQVDFLRAADERQLAARLTSLHGELAAAWNRAHGIEQELLPSATETYELTQIGYRYGKFGLLDVLDAQRTLIDVREQYFEALAAYQLAAVQVERLIAQPLSDGSLWQIPAPASEADSAVSQDSPAEPNSTAEPKETTNE